MLSCGTVGFRQGTKVCNRVPLAGFMVRNTKAMNLGTRLGVVLSICTKNSIGNPALKHQVPSASSCLFRFPSVG